MTDTGPDGEVLHPVALPDTGLDIEQELATAACNAGMALVTPGQTEWAVQQGVRVMVPVERHIEGAQVVGVARLRYRPRTARTLAFVAREGEWTAALARLRRIEADALGGQQQRPCNIKD